MTKLNQTGAVSAGISIAVALVVGLAVGFGAGHVNSNKNDNHMTMHTSSTKAADLRATLVSLGVQHQQLAQRAVDAAIDGSPDAEAVKAQLIQNGKDISDAVASVYGQAAGQQFNDIWNVHLVDFVKYATAAKSGDEAAKQAAAQDIDTNYTKPISKLLASANPNLPEQTLESGFREHIDMTAQAVDDHAKGDYTAEQALIVKSSDHIKMLMGTLADAIVKQKPNQF